MFSSYIIFDYANNCYKCYYSDGYSDYKYTKEVVVTLKTQLEKIHIGSCHMLICVNYFIYIQMYFTEKRFFTPRVDRSIAV